MYLIHCHLEFGIWFILNSPPKCFKDCGSLAPLDRHDEWKRKFLCIAVVELLKRIKFGRTALVLPGTRLFITRSIGQTAGAGNTARKVRMGS